MGLGILSTLGCCFSSAACSLCCSACPSCRNSTASRIAYGLVIVFATLLSLVTMTSLAREQLAKIGPLCEQFENAHNCEQMVGYFAVYRIMFAMTVFFVLMAILMIGVNTSKDKRAALQNGFWAVKVAVVGGIATGAMFIPYGDFEHVWMYFGLVGGFAFILLQLIFLIDFAYTWNEKWVSRMEEDDDEGCKKWFALLLSVTIVVFLACIVGVVLMFMYYGGEGCGLNKFFISINMLLCFVLSVSSILPMVQEANPSSGLLQSSIVSAYILFLTWSAMTSSTKANCNPQLGDILSGNTDHRKDGEIDQSNKLDTASIVSVVIWVCLVMYSSISTAGKVGVSAAPEEDGFVAMNDVGPTRGAGGDDDEDEERGGQKVYDDEADGVAYNYSLFHLVLACAALYIMMCLTNWLDPQGQLQAFQRSNAAMWVKMTSAWICAGLYGWTLVAPLVLTNRDFSL